MTLEQMKQAVEDYEATKNYLHSQFVKYMNKQGRKPPFYKATWGSYSIDEIDFDADKITFIDDDFYHGYDLHDYDYQTVLISDLLKVE